MDPSQPSLVPMHSLCDSDQFSSVHFN